MSRDFKWDLWCVHAERGKETLRQAARLYAAHDLRHLAQIERTLKRVAK